MIALLENRRLIWRAIWALLLAIAIPLCLVISPGIHSESRVEMHYPGHSNLYGLFVDQVLAEGALDPGCPDRVRSVFGPKALAKLEKTFWSVPVKDTYFLVEQTFVNTRDPVVSVTGYLIALKASDPIHEIVIDFDVAADTEYRIEDFRIRNDRDARNLRAFLKKAEHGRAIDHKAVSYCFEGLSALMNGDSIYTAARFSGAIAAQPDYALAYLGRGLSYWLAGHKEAGIADMDKAIALDSHFTKAYLYRALARTSTEIPYTTAELEKAEQDSRMALSLEPESAESLATVSYVAYHQMNDREALRFAERALLIDPHNFWARATVDYLDQDRNSRIQYSEH
ncbi:MAG: tetratricopeptide repeat protein [Candidatus Obscuribacterales bacterium]